MFLDWLEGGRRSHAQSPPSAVAYCGPTSARESLNVVSSAQGNGVPGLEILRTIVAMPAWARVGHSFVLV